MSVLYRSLWSMSLGVISGSTFLEKQVTLQSVARGYTSVTHRSLWLFPPVPGTLRGTPDSGEGEKVGT